MRVCPFLYKGSVIYLGAFEFYYLNMHTSSADNVLERITIILGILNVPPADSFFLVPSLSA